MRASFLPEVAPEAIAGDAGEETARQGAARDAAEAERGRFRIGETENPKAQAEGGSQDRAEEEMDAEGGNPIHPEFLLGEHRLRHERPIESTVGHMGGEYIALRAEPRANAWGGAVRWKGRVGAGQGRGGE